jgi:hypothetical protein
MSKPNVGALMIVSHELKHLEQTWQKQMLKIVKVKGLAAQDIVDIVQEMTAVQGRLFHMHWAIDDKLKNKKKEEV